MALWWLSFADPERPAGTQFLGASIVNASSFIEAVRVSHIIGINPGGEVKSVEIPDEAASKIPASFIERLLSMKEIEELDAVITGKEGNGKAAQL